MTLDKRAGRVGITLRDIPGAGVEVAALDPQGLAAHAGLAEGDVLLKVNGTPCVTHSQAIKLIDAEAPPQLVIELHSWSAYQSLVNAILSRGAVPPDQVVRGRLDKFAPLRAEAEQFVSMHQQLVKDVEEANEEFTRARINETEFAERQQYFKLLSQAVAAYLQLSTQMSEGVGFFTACKERLEALHDQMRDHAVARSLEREELAARLVEESRLAQSSDGATNNIGVTVAPLLGALSLASADSDVPDSPELSANCTRLMEMGFSREQSLGAHARRCAASVPRAHPRRVGRAHPPRRTLSVRQERSIKRKATSPRRSCCFSAPTTPLRRLLRAVWTPRR